MRRRRLWGVRSGEATGILVWEIFCREDFAGRIFLFKRVFIVFS